MILSAGEQVEAGFSQDDYHSKETEGSISPIVVVMGNQENGDIEFRVDALTRQQLIDQGIECFVEDQQDLLELLPPDAVEAECM